MTTRIDNEILTAEYLIRALELDMADEFASWPILNKTPDLVGKDVGDFKSGINAYIARASNFPLRRGSDMESQTYQEGKMTVTADKRIGVDVSVSSLNLSAESSPSQFQATVTEPAQRRLKNGIDTDVLAAIGADAPNMLAERVTNENVLEVILRVSERMTALGLPRKGRHLIVPPKIHSAAILKVLNLNDPATVGAIVKDGVIERLLGFDVVQSPNLPRIGINPPLSTFTIKLDAIPTWDSVKDSWKARVKLNVTNSTAGGTLKKGTRFDIDGLLALNAESHVEQDFKQPFILLDDISYTTTSQEFSVYITPPPIPQDLTKDKAHCNVSHYSASATNTKKCNLLGSKVLKTGEAALTTIENVGCMVAYHDSGIIVPQLSLVLPPSAQGSVSKGVVNMRAISGYHPSSDSYDQRLDVQFGVSVYKQHAIWLAVYTL